MSTLERIDKALAELPAPLLSVAAVSRHANISRTCLYESHPEIVQRIRERRASARMKAPEEHLHSELRAELQRAKRLVKQLIALVDHYAVAYQESQEVLKQRDREIGQLNRRLQSAPVMLHFKKKESGL